MGFNKELLKKYNIEIGVESNLQLYKFQNPYSDEMDYCCFEVKDNNIFVHQIQYKSSAWYYWYHNFNNPMNYEHIEIYLSFNNPISNSSAFTLINVIEEKKYINNSLRKIKLNSILNE